MSQYSGPQGRGARRARRTQKREEAIARQEAFERRNTVPDKESTDADA